MFWMLGLAVRLPCLDRIGASEHRTRNGGGLGGMQEEVLAPPSVKPMGEVLFFEEQISLAERRAAAQDGVHVLHSGVPVMHVGLCTLCWDERMSGETKKAGN